MTRAADHVVESLPSAVISAAHRLYERRLVAGRQGNISARDTDGTIWVTPAGMCKGDVTVADLVRLDLDGNVLDGTRKPTSERTTHLEFYRRRPDVNAVVHGHPLYCTTFAAARESLPVGVLPEAVVTLGEVPLVPYGTASSIGLTSAIGPFISRHDCFLLANHGALTVGANLDIATDRLEQLESYAAVIWHARALGGAKALGEAELAALRGLE